MNTELQINQDTDLTVILDESGGSVTLRAQHHRNVTFTRQYKDGRLIEERLPVSHSPVSHNEKLWVCTVQIDGPGVTGIRIGFDNSEGLAYIVREAFVTIKTEPKPEVRCPVAPAQGEKVTLKQQAEQAFLEAVEQERQEIEEDVEEILEKTRDSLFQAAASVTKVGLVGHFHPDHFEFESDSVQENTEFEMQPIMAKSKMMKRLIERLINEEKLTIKATILDTRGPTVKLTATF